MSEQKTNMPNKPLYKEAKPRPWMLDLGGLLELKALLEATTPLPWWLEYNLGDEEGPLHEPEFSGEILACSSRDEGSILVAHGLNKQNAEFIVRAREDMFVLIAALAAAEAKATRLEKEADWLALQLEGKFAPWLGRTNKFWREQAAKAVEANSN